MGYEIISVNPENGSIIASLVTAVVHQSAHLLLGSLGLDYDQDDEEGNGDSWSFIDAELSAAEEALIAACATPDEELRKACEEALSFLSDTRLEMSRINLETVEIGVF